jgi:hypothetical protein
VSSELDREFSDVIKNVEQARTSVAGADWLRAAQALLAVQDRVGRALRKIELRRAVHADGGDAAPQSTQE